MDYCGFEKEDLMMLMAAAFCDGADGGLCVYLSKYKTEDHHYLFGVFMWRVMLSYLFLVRRRRTAYTWSGWYF